MITVVTSFKGSSIIRSSGKEHFYSPNLHHGNKWKLKSLIDDISVNIYDTQLLISGMLDSQLSSASPASVALLYAAGLLTSFSPCAISLLPLTLAYLGTSEEDAVGGFSIAGNIKLVKSISYAAGLAITLAAFGLGAALLGQLFGSSSTNTFGNLPSLLAAAISFIMGLNLLGVVQFSFPSPGENSNILFFANKLPAYAQAFVLGASSAVISSPCSSPVLSSLLAFVASSGRPAIGSIFLFIFSLGYATPVVAAGALSGAANTLYTSKGIPWINNTLASVLVGFGTYSLLDYVWK